MPSLSKATNSSPYMKLASLRLSLLTRDIACTYFRAFIILFAIYLLSCTSIVLADVAYVDDIHRIATGYSGWSGSSRYISDFMAPFIHGSSKLADVSPLTLIIAAAEVAAAGVILLKSFSATQKFTLWQIFSLIPLCISPFFLQCLSYKYDAPYMALSVLFSVIPLLFAGKKLPVFFTSVFLCILGVCMTYQASLGILPASLALMEYTYWLRKKEQGEKVWKVIGIGALSFIIALVFYKLFLVNQVAGYADSNLPPLNSLFVTILTNYETFIQTILTNFRGWWLGLIGFFLLGFVATMAIFAKRSTVSTARAIIFGILSLFFALLVSLGVYPLMEQPIFDPRACYGFTAVLSVLFLVIATYGSSLLINICITIISFEFVVFSFAYGNALAEQQDWTILRTNDVVEALAEIPAINNGEECLVQLKGSIGPAPQIKYQYNDPDSSLIKNLVRVTFYGDGWTGYQRLFYYYGFDFKNAPLTTEEDYSYLPVVSENYYHIIRAEENKIQIELKDVS